METSRNPKDQTNIIGELNSLAEMNMPLVRDSQAIAVLYKSADNLLQQVSIFSPLGNELGNIGS